jgi:hypothetical protein
MGIITSLIQANRNAKQQDFNNHLGVLTQLASQDNLTDDAKKAVWGSIASLTGPHLDLPKAQHGVFGDLLHGFSKLNPAPSDPYAAGMIPLPPSTPAINSQVPDTSNPVPGQMLPGADATSPFLTVPQMAARAAASKAFGEQSEFNEQQRQADVKTARLKNIFAGNENDPMYKEMLAEVQTGVKQQHFYPASSFRSAMMPMRDPKTGVVSPKLVSIDPTEGRWYNPDKSPVDPSLIAGAPSFLNTSANGGPKAKATRIQVKGADGQPVWQSALAHPDGSFTTLGNDEIPIESILNASASGEPKVATARESYNQHDLEVIADNKFPKATKEAKAAWVGNRLAEIINARLASTQLHNQQTIQNMGVTAADSGIGAGGSRGSGGANIDAPLTAPAAVTAPTAAAATSTKATAPNGAAPIAAGGKPPAIDTPGGGISADMMNKLERTDPNVQAYLSSLDGLPGASRSKGQNIRIMAGRNTLLNLMPPGYNLESLAAERTLREGSKKALSNSLQQAVAYDSLSNQMSNLGQQFEAARAKFPAASPKWAQIKQYIAQNYTGDPDTAALVTAANEFQKTYGRFASGGGRSTAQTNVAAQGKVDDIINAAMTGKSIAAVLSQVKQGADNDIKGIKTTLKSGREGLAKPWGSFTENDVVPDRSPASTNPQGAGDSNSKEQVNGLGAYRYTTDGGKTWLKGRLPKP